MEEKNTANRFEKTLINIWFALLVSAVGLNVYLMIASQDWLLRLCLFIFFLLPCVYSIYFLLKRERTGQEETE